MEMEVGTTRTFLYIYIYIYNIDRRHKKWGMREWEKNSNLIG